MKFLCKEQNLVLKKGVIFFVSVPMCRTVRMRRNHHYFKWIQSSLGGKKNLICRRFFTAAKKKKKFPSGNFSRAATAKKSDQKSVRNDARAVCAE